MTFFFQYIWGLVTNLSSYAFFKKQDSWMFAMPLWCFLAKTKQNKKSKYNLCQVYAPNESPSIIFGPLVQWLSFQRRRRTLKIMASLLSIISNRLHIIINMCSHLRRVSIFWVNWIFLTERDMSVSKFFVHLTKWGITINEFCVSARRADTAILQKMLEALQGWNTMTVFSCLHKIINSVQTWVKVVKC